MKRNPVNNAGWEELDISGTAPDAADFSRTSDTSSSKKAPDADEDFSDADEGEPLNENSDDDNADSFDTESDSDTEAGDDAGDAGDDTSEAADTEAKKETASEKVAPSPKVPRAEKRIKQLIDLVKAKDEEAARTRFEYDQLLREREARLQSYQEALAETLATSSDAKIQAAEAKLRKAKQEVDVEAEIQATRELQEAVSEKQNAIAYKRSMPAKETAGSPDMNEAFARQKTSAWIQANPDLVSSQELKNLVARVAQSVEKEGLKPHEDDYYTEINKRVNERMKEYGSPIKARSPYAVLDDYADSDDAPSESEAPVKPKAPQGARPNVSNPMSAPRAPAKRSASTTVNKVTAEDAAFARRLGINPSDLLKNAMLEDRANKFGYTPVYIPKKKK